MAAPKGNQFWKLRSSHGRDKLFASPELLLEAAEEYFEWCDKNPFTEDKLFSYQGAIINGLISKMRAYTREGLCLYLGCSDSYLRVFKSTSQDDKNEDFLTVIEHIETVIDNQQFTGAAADLLNANIISRKLGLTDKTDLTTNGNDINTPSREQRDAFLKSVQDEIQRAKK